MALLLAFYASNQLIRDIRAFNAHDAFLGAAVTQKIDAAIPDSFLIPGIMFLPLSANPALSVTGHLSKTGSFLRL